MLGWPEQVDCELKPYFNRHLEFSTHDDCILWGIRVVILPPAHSTVLAELHRGHPGITRMKTLTQHLVWWPNLDQTIEDVVQQCEDCQQSQVNLPPAPFHPWQWPTCPWTRLILILLDPWR